jgi:hypothetical protein
VPVERLDFCDLADPLVELVKERSVVEQTGDQQALLVSLSVRMSPALRASTTRSTTVIGQPASTKAASSRTLAGSKLVRRMVFSLPLWIGKAAPILGKARRSVQAGRAGRQSPPSGSAIL